MFDTGYRILGAGARGWPREMIWGGRWEGGSGLGTHVHPWLIYVNVWQNQYSIVKQNKVKINIKKINKDTDVMNGKGNGNPLLYSCLEKPTDRGAWWAAVHGVAKSGTWRKRLSTHDIMKSQEAFCPLPQLSIFCQSLIYLSAHIHLPCSYHLNNFYCC